MVPLLPNLLVHLLENTAISASLLLQRQYLILARLLPLPSSLYRVLMSRTIIPFDELDLLPQLVDWVRQ